VQSWDLGGEDGVGLGFKRLYKELCIYSLRGDRMGGTSGRVGRGEAGSQGSLVSDAT
jgi:hypothetical protein